jgi:hypothetical protein
VSLFGPLHRRAHRRGPAGHQRINRQRFIALAMIATGLGRVAIWLSLIFLYSIGVAFAINLFKSVAFVALISMISLALTDWGQVAASLAQLTAGDAHHDIEATRLEASIDTASIERDLARLAQLEPGPEGERLAAEIRAQIAGTSA